MRRSCHLGKAGNNASKYGFRYAQRVIRAPPLPGKGDDDDARFVEEEPPNRVCVDVQTLGGIRHRQASIREFDRKVHIRPPPVAPTAQGQNLAAFALRVCRRQRIVGQGHRATRVVVLTSGRAVSRSAANRRPQRAGPASEPPQGPEPSPRVAAADILDCPMSFQPRALHAMGPGVSGSERHHRRAIKPPRPRTASVEGSGETWCGRRPRYSDVN
jgi:hypothetical protein